MTANGGLPRLVTVFGASGFVGRHVVGELARQGVRIRAAERRPDLAGHLQPLGGVGQIMPVQANLRYPDSVARAVEGADAVINLVAILGERGRQTFQALHVDGARTVARSATAAGAATFVHVSAIGADPAGGSRYARSKAAGEAAVFAEFPLAIVLRPSIIFGPDDQFFNRFAALAETAPILPAIGGGRTRLQPVYVADVARAIAAAVEGRARPGTIYELGGPEIRSFREFLNLTMSWAGRRRPLLPLPFSLAKLGAALTKPLPLSWRPLTVDQVRSLQSDNIVSEAAKRDGRTLSGLGIEPLAAAAIVPGYLKRFHDKGQFASA